jgi:formylglycine-generating enzyme required for sulfatase activity
MKLPTEAQWEFACRAGLREPTYGGWGITVDQRLNPIAWSRVNSAGRTHPVAQKAPNALGFYDMLGNVSEWCEDWYGSDYYKSCEDGVVDPLGPQSGESRVLRGGSWGDYAGAVRSSYRPNYAPDNPYYDIGFRVARAP